MIARFAELNCERVAVKRGVRGPVDPALSDNAYPIFKPAASIRYDRSGDSFNGGYLAVLSGADASSLLQGHDLAAKVVGAPGAIMDKSASS